MKKGTGIYVKGENVLLFGCDVTNYKDGIKVNSLGSVLANNKACGNQRDINSLNSDNFGIKNRCDISINWNENGASGCTLDCNGGQNQAAQGQCPECVCEECPTCEECPVCEEEEIEVEEETEEEEELVLCPDGSYAKTKEDCPEEEEEKILCPDGKTYVKSKEDCPEEEKEELILCPDGKTYVKDKEDCPEEKEELVLCPDGSYAKTKEDCPEVEEEKILCPDGKTYVKDKEDCPEEEKEYDVCCAITSKSLAAAATTSYQIMTNKECEEKGGKEVDDKYCKTIGKA
jgi:hypothetical protein